MFVEQATDPATAAATERTKLAGEMQDRVLKPALLALFQNGPDQLDFRDKDSNRKADLFLKRFDVVVDVTFFDDLWREIDHDGHEAQKRERAVWVHDLLHRAEGLLHDAESAAARASRRRFRAIVRARDRLRAAAFHNEQLKPYLEETDAV
jgi:CRISPR system Cascade subunit CasA